MNDFIITVFCGVTCGLIGFMIGASNERSIITTSTCNEIKFEYGKWSSEKQKIVCWNESPLPIELKAAFDLLEQDIKEKGEEK